METTPLSRESFHSLIQEQQLLDQKQGLHQAKAKQQQCHFFSVRFYRNLSYFFGCRFLILIINTQMLLKGALKMSMDSLALPFSQHLGQGSSQLQVMFQMLQVPWSLKGIIGILSDVAPILGYYKLIYMLISVVLSLGGILVLTLVPASTLGKSMWLVYVCFMVSMLAPATNDLLSEGKYTQIMTEYPQTKSDIISFVWFWQYTGRLVVSGYVGAVNEHLGPYPLLWSTVVFCVVTLVLLCFNFLQEDREFPRKGVDWQKLKDMKKYAVMALLMVIFNVVGSFVSASISTTVNFAYTWIVALLSIVAGFLTLPTPIAKCNAYIFFSHAIIPNISGATQNWYTAQPSCVPNGTHFTLTYYQTVTNTVTNIIVLITVIFFQNYMSEWTFRKCVFVGCALLAVSHCNDFVIMKRWNIDYLHIPDKAMFIVGDAVVQPVLNVFNFLPGSILLSRMCPRSIATTVFALLSGFSSFGYVAATATGSFILKQLGVSLSREGPCSYEHLPTASLICTVLIPSLMIPLAYLLLPDLKMSDPVPQEQLKL